MIIHTSSRSLWKVGFFVVMLRAWTKIGRYEATVRRMVEKTYKAGYLVEGYIILAVESSVKCNIRVSSIYSCSVTKKVVVARVRCYCVVFENIRTRARQTSITLQLGF